jgi:hypothetical protein
VSLQELSEIRLVDVVLQTRSGIEIHRRCVSRPTDHQRILLEKLELRLPSGIIQSQAPPSLIRPYHRHRLGRVSC